MKQVKDIDMTALHKDLQAIVEPPKRRGWFRRNWRWFVPVLLLTIIVGGAGALYWNFFIRVYNLEVFQAAMRTIGADKDMQKTLGQPIEPVRRPPSLFSKAGWQEIVPTARIEENEIDITKWQIEGPKGQAKAHLLAKKRGGEWQIVMLEVTPVGGKKVSLHEAGGGEDEAPVFHGGAPTSPPAQGKKQDAKSPDINIDLPGLPPDAPAEKK